jgi:membrane protein YdbS with pleckstrin-like domain
MEKHKLHPGARWTFRIRAYLGLIVLVFLLGTFGIPAAVAIFSILNSTALTAIMVFISIIFYIGIIIIIGEIYARMTYNRWFYEFSDHGLKLERGIIWKRYSNVPYERIQNVDVQRGILARILGFSTVIIQTAGYSGQGKYGMNSEGYIPAVGMKDAEKIREFIMKKITGKKSSGGL